MEILTDVDASPEDIEKAISELLDLRWKEMEKDEWVFTYCCMNSACDFNAVFPVFQGITTLDENSSHVRCPHCGSGLRHSKTTYPKNFD